MKKILSALFATSYLLAQLFVYAPVSYAAGEFHSSIGDKFKIINVEKTNVFSNSAVGANSTGGNTAYMQPYKITWQITTAMKSEIESGQLVNFQLFRKYDNYPEKVVAAGISPFYYFAADPGVNSTSPQYKVEALLVDGQKYQTEYYQYGAGEVVESTPNIVNTPTNSGTMVNTEVDPVDGKPVSSGTIDSSIVNDIMGYIKPFFSTLGSNISSQTDIGDLNNGDILDMAKQFADGGIIDDVDSTYDYLIGARDNRMPNSKLTFESVLERGLKDRGITPATGNGSVLSPDLQNQYENNLKLINRDLLGDGTNGDTNMSGDGYSEDATESANFFTGLMSSINPVNMDNYQCQYNTGVLCVVENIIRLALTLASLIAIAFVVYGGYLYITSAGNQEGSQAGIKAVTNAAIGLVIILASWIIINTVLNVISQGTLGT